MFSHLPIRQSYLLWFSSVRYPVTSCPLHDFFLTGGDGGGYGSGNAGFDLVPQILTNGNKYITVAIQYRLGAFGFLSSADVAKSGVLNAGIHDQYFALQWVQKYIHLFGGDPKQVTIGGVSAGGGSVMLLGMANGGVDNTTLFNGLFVSSPYLPTQW